MPDITLMLMTFHHPQQSCLGVAMRCFRSLKETMHRAEVETLVLDQGSTDGTAEWLLRLKGGIPNFLPLLSTKNWGVAGGRQELLDRAKGDILIFLDSDVVAINGDWLDLLIAPLLDGASVGLAGPGGHWVLPDWQWYDPVEKGYAGEVDTVSGFCQAFTRSSIAGFAMDPYFNPYWHEDTDMAMYIKSRGEKVWCTGDIGLHHIFSGSNADATGMKKQAYLASKWAGRGLVRHEREGV